MSLQSIVIVGGGIGGLNLAHALVKYNPSLSVTVYEQIKSPNHQQGWHLGINSQGLDAMKEAEIPDLDKATDKNMVSAFVCVDQNLNELLRFGGPMKQGKSDSALAILHRRTLHKLLAKNVNVVYGKRFTRYEEHDDHVDVHFEDGSKVSADFVVGADGCWSLIRKQLAPSIRYTPVGVTQVGVMFPAPDPSAMPTLMTWLDFAMLRSSSPSGFSILSGIAANDDGGKDMFIGISWVDNAIKEMLPESNQEVHQWMKQIVKTHFHPEFSALVDMTTVDHIVLGGPRKVHSTNYQEHCPLLNIKHKRVTLIGDAAHAMTTNKGMGANTALMDSIDLAKTLTSSDWEGGLADYESTMWKRGSFEVKDSLRNTFRNHSTGPVNFAMSKVFMKCFNQVLVWKGISYY
ncbi:FAD/NAD(P)-binding domain-containing protein [Hesseltinella vesiculosa]|uniref:FAD/NAD(P)-binding domain-containing protein n=1 Tax=Hesseltinella vesiculosa TaxID=101127 RepID=A0A1X2GLJ2_9FUNG|nr:FAD/NAD(P)-binding domain-containing protein [Hesseltinella vesiculosa]